MSKQSTLNRDSTPVATPRIAPFMRKLHVFVGFFPTIRDGNHVVFAGICTLDGLVADSAYPLVAGHQDLDINVFNKRDIRLTGTIAGGAAAGEDAALFRMRRYPGTMLRLLLLAMLRIVVATIGALFFSRRSIIGRIIGSVVCQSARFTDPTMWPKLTALFHFQTPSTLPGASRQRTENIHTSLFPLLATLLTIFAQAIGDTFAWIKPARVFDVQALRTLLLAFRRLERRTSFFLPRRGTVGSKVGPEARLAGFLQSSIRTTRKLIRFFNLKTLRACAWDFWQFCGTVGSSHGRRLLNRHGYGQGYQRFTVSDIPHPTILPSPHQTEKHDTACLSQAFLLGRDAPSRPQ